MRKSSRFPHHARPVLLGLLPLLGACVDETVHADDRGDTTAGETGEFGETGETDETGETGETEGSDECGPPVAVDTEAPTKTWRAELSSNNEDRFRDLAVDADDSVIVVGAYAPETTDAWSPPNAGAFVTKLGPDGEQLWSRVWADESVWITSEAVELGSDGTIFVVGTNGNSTTLTALTPEGGERWRHDLGFGLGRALSLGPGGQIYVGNDQTGDAHVLRVSEAGELEWDTSAYVSDEADLLELAVGCDGSIYAAGSQVESSIEHVERRAIVVKLDPAGALEWERSESYGNEEYVDVTVIGDAVYVVGNVGVNLSQGESGQSFVRRIDPAGEFLWTEILEPPDSITAAAALGEGLVVAHAQTTLTLLSSSGGLEWSATIDLEGDQIDALALGPDASLFVGREYNGGSTLTDIYVSRLDQP